ncbi:MAG: serine hydrolase [Nitrososphaerota archaeon]
MATRGRKRTLLLSALVALVVLMPVLAGGIWVRVHAPPNKLVVVHRATPGGSFPWSSATRTTAPSAQYAVFAQQHNPVDPAFQAYYARENGQVLLGNALTPAYPTQLGWLQIFANGALILPLQNSTSTTNASAPDGLDPALLHAGTFDSATGIVRLPLLNVLLTIGSKIPLGGSDSAITYVTLRDATAPSHMAHLPVWRPIQSATAGANGVFIIESTSKGIASGHTIPLTVWNYITDNDVSPDDWHETFGDPLTEALPTTTTINGASHHLLVQAFALATVAIDLDDDDDQGQPTGMVLPLGRDYLQTLGPPSVAVTAGENVWLTGNTAIVTTPGGNSASAHLGANFPLALSGQAQWLNGALWYQATWKSPHRSGSGWTAASTVTITAPPKDAAAWASFDALSPDIAKYLASFGTNVSSVVYDITRNRYYTYNENTAFVLASSSKVSIMVSYLSWVESQKRGINDFENTELINMIEHSDNNAAQLLFDRLGGGPGMQAFYQRIGVAGYRQSPYGWGWAMLPPIGQVKVLTLLQQGEILTAQDRAYALNLMSHIESDQRMGVGETLPPGATVAMKDGWVPAPDGLWAINTSGIVTDGSETYIIVVYTAHQSDYEGAWNITRHVCKTVGQLLV